ncbi:MAG: glycosyltransferase family 4 protein [Thainema sp.]
MRLLFVSTPVGPLGSGLGGGVELTLRVIGQDFIRRGHQVTVVAPATSELTGIEVIEIPGQFQTAAQTQTRDVPITLPGNAVLANMWSYAQTVQQDYDLLVNFAYDWLPFYLTPFFETAIAHFISMGSLSEALDQVANQVIQVFPGTIGVYTRTQAETFSFADQCRCLGSGIDLSQYEFNAAPESALAWLGRISPEKGLEDAVAAAQATQIPLKIMGKVEDQAYWRRIQATYPSAPIEYLGFLSTDKLQAILRQCRALVMTPRWVEAFGIVAIEALACGVPVIAYQRGGPAEIVQSGQTGWLVEPDSVDGLIDAIGDIDQLNRHYCRQQAEQLYSLDAFSQRFEQWFQDILS